MYAIICLGKSAEVYGPFDNSSQARGWLFNHCLGDQLCKNGIWMQDHSIDIMWTPECRICGTMLLYDRDNHPSDRSLCYKHNDISDEREHGLL